MTRLGLGLVDEVTNDLRPPLTVIKGCLETVLANWDTLDDAQREELLSAALKGADDLVAGVGMLEARLEAVERALGGEGTAIPPSLALDR
jgi:K+-sensing histidine kinase KdpD